MTGDEPEPVRKNNQPRNPELWVIGVENLSHNQSQGTFSIYSDYNGFGFSMIAMTKIR